MFKSLFEVKKSTRSNAHSRKRTAVEAIEVNEETTLLDQIPPPMIFSPRVPAVEQKPSGERRKRHANNLGKKK